MTKIKATEASDIPVGNWVDRLVPVAAQPYMRMARFDRPIGTWLLLFPGWWAIALASPGLPSLWLVVLFGVGAMVMRGSGCVFNDITDRHIDGKVARTALRPIPSGAVTVFQAAVYMVFLALVGFAILLQFNIFAIWVGAASLILIAVYPFMKRITYWPQAMLGLTFNWGALLGWAAVQGSLSAPSYILYAAGFFWTLGYDTIYAHQDKEDDLIAGVKSSALKLGDNTGPWLWVFHGLAIALIGVSGWLVELSWPFYVALGLATLQLAWQSWDVDIDDPKDCLAKFHSNRWFGWCLFLGIIAGQAVD
ncbi:MAG: 4-hydroxybenzoate octaprenyltransferase [Proteobacteria bacterium]|nr:4-hydroxybenzoate octaprenyltransferase [Pseudomonadota bacterium]